MNKTKGSLQQKELTLETLELLHSRIRQQDNARNEEEYKKIMNDIIDILSSYHQQLCDTLKQSIENKDVLLVGFDNGECLTLQKAGEKIILLPWEIKVLKRLIINLE